MVQLLATCNISFFPIQIRCSSYCTLYQLLDSPSSAEHKKSGTEEADLLEVILPTLERVLQYLPDKINDLWHYHGIGECYLAVLFVVLLLFVCVF